MVSRTEPWQVVHDQWVVLEDQGWDAHDINQMQTVEPFRAESTPSSRGSPSPETDEETKEIPIFRPEMQVDVPRNSVLRPQWYRSSGRSVLEVLLLGGERRSFDVESLSSKSEVISEIEANSVQGDLLIKNEDSLTTFLIQQLQQAREGSATSGPFVAREGSATSGPFAVQKGSDDTLKSCVAQIKALNAQASNDKTGESIKGLVRGSVITVSLLLLCLLAIGKCPTSDARRLIRRLHPVVPADLNFGFINLYANDHTSDMMGYVPL
eukprot:GEMP01036787.1.p1 GENE.GEMP01036787.1~~GEMP01036787.1.p1  ORF type:complete len:274 (+),score=52.36 GEMP01036787.1:23-823(+)